MSAVVAAEQRLWAEIRQDVGDMAEPAEPDHLLLLLIAHFVLEEAEEHIIGQEDHAHLVVDQHHQEDPVAAEMVAITIQDMARQQHQEQLILEAAEDQAVQLKLIVHPDPLHVDPKRVEMVDLV